MNIPAAQTAPTIDSDQIDNLSPVDQLKIFIEIMASNAPPPSPPVTDGARPLDGLGQLLQALGDVEVR